MTAAILCPGPSLCEFDRTANRGGDLRIGVNRAATLIPCDVWCATDYPLYERARSQVLGSPIWFTAEASAEQIDQRGIRWRGQVITCESIPDPFKTVDWDFFSLLAAIGYAVHAGCRRIEVYGADWSGVKDFDGVEAGNTRHDERWKLESSLFELARQELAGRGITIIRMRPPLFVAYYTADTPYEFEAVKLRATLEQFKLRHEIHPVPNRGSWQKNTQYKSRFIRDMLQAHHGPIVYVDVDALVLKPPVLFDELLGDVAAAKFLDQELLSGTVWFANTPICRDVVDRWIGNCEKYPDYCPPGVLRHYPQGEAAWDQRLLDLALCQTPEARFIQLPQEYTYIEDLSRERYPGLDPVILHTRGRSRLEHLVNR
jgi:hypothetical protein